MKKIIATVLATVMILSILATIAIVPTAAASTDDGDWAVYAGAGAYEEDENGEVHYDDPTSTDANVPGYQYTEDGFRASLDSEASMGTTQRFNIMTKKKVNLKQQGVHMTVRVDEFKYGGDWWFSFYIWDSPNIQQGDDTGKFGNGYFNLFRGSTTKTGPREDPIETFNAMYNLQSYISDQRFYDKTGTCLQPGSETDPMKFNILDFGTNTGNAISDEGKNPVPDENGALTLEMDLQWDGSNYRLFFCGVEVVPSAVIDNYLKDRFADGFAYIGFGVNGSKTDCTTTVTVTEFNGETPTGSDSADPVYNSEPIGPMIDTSTLDPDDPVLLFDAANENDEYPKTGKFASSSGLKTYIKSDNSFTLYPEKETAAFFMIAPRGSITYEASDYPFVAVLFRNFCCCPQYEGEEYECIDTEYLYLYYCAGKILNPNEEYRTDPIFCNGNVFEDEYGNTYKLFLFDLSVGGELDVEEGAWQGRINRVEFVFTGLNITDPELDHFDMCYTAFFQNEDAALNYTETYVDSYEECLHEDKTIVPEKAASCTEMGYTESIICNTCGEVIEVSQNIPALDHDWQASPAIAPTCEDYGREAGNICTLCGDTDAMGIDPIGHLLNVYTTTDEGHCQECQREGCDYATAIEEHTIGGNGVCTVCGHGCPHANTTWTDSQVATCTAPGARVETCDDCHAAVGSEETPALGHTEEVLPAIAATCTEAGRTEGKICTVCNTTTVPQTTISALGHTEEVVPGTEATCTETGLTDGKVCTVCGETTVEQTETAVTEHTYDDDKDTTCNVCGATRTIPTQAPTTTPTESNGNDDGGDDGEDEGGCGSVIGLGAFAVIATIGLAGVVSLKKKED